MYFARILPKNDHSYYNLFSYDFPIIFHRFGVDLDSILRCFLALKSEKIDTKNTAKTFLQKSHAGHPANSGTGSCGPLKQFKDPRSQDWEPNPGIMTFRWCLAGH